MAARPNREPTLVWRKSRRSGGDGACVEVAVSDSCVLVRDSRDHLEPRLAFGPAQWRQFVHRIKDDTALLG
jgi:hypothetical protein